MTNAATLAAVAASGFRRNRIHNGAFQSDQRYLAQGTALVMNGTYIGDRWGASKGSANVGDVSARYSITGAPSPYGLVYSITTGVAPAAADFNGFYQQIEAFDMTDLRWGTAAAKPVTLSFDIYTPLAGLYTVRMCNPAYNRSYVGTYTVAAANTWQRCFITIPGDVTGTWPALNEKWNVAWDMGSGSNYNAAAAGVWGAGNFTRVAGSVNFAAAVRLLYITNVQLEAGTIATPFEWRSMRDQVADCQRWYQRQSTMLISSGYSIAGDTMHECFLFPVLMRNTPTVVFSNVSGNNSAAPTVNAVQPGNIRVAAVVPVAGSAYAIFDMTLDTELT